MVVNRQEAREGFWGEHHDLLSCRAWCRETHWIAAATRRGWSVGGGCGEEKHTGLEGLRCGGFFEKKILLHNFNVVIKTGSVVQGRQKLLERGRGGRAATMRPRV